MSLPNYLARIKSSGVYRFVWDKSVVPPQQAETLRLVVGYSDKGPFNTPVYITSVPMFNTIFGKGSKKLERKGVYFHRMARQALAAGPILALNLKYFENESVTYKAFDKIDGTTQGRTLSTENKVEIAKLYNTERFWKLEPEDLVTGITDQKVFKMVMPDTKESSCSVVIRQANPDSADMKKYKMTIKEWYLSIGEEMPEYLEPIQNTMLNNYFMDVYIFGGEIAKFASIMPEYFNTTLDSNPTWSEPKVTTNPIEKSGYTILYKVSSETPAKATGKAPAGWSAEYPINSEKQSIYYIEAANTGNSNNIKARIKDPFGNSVDTLEVMAEDPKTNFINAYTGCVIPYFKDALNNYISIDLLVNGDYNKHKMIMKIDEEQFESAVQDPSDSLYNPTYKKTESYTITYFKGYEYNLAAENIVSKSLSMMDSEGMYNALTNRVDIEYHYIVDTFDTAPNIASDKIRFATIAKAKQNAFAFLNFPKMKSFNVSVSEGKSFMEAVADEMEKNMPSEVQGAAYCAYFTQLKFADGAMKYTVPSAALVSNNFMQKWGPRQPYYIVAGPNYGVISYAGLIGPDYNFGRSDLDQLEPLGINAIIYVPRLGVYINSNQTAKQKPVSGLSKIHIMELVIYLQDEIEALLQSYQWELNTQELRDKIKEKADTICENIQNNHGIYVFRNICDETNNTTEVIDNEMLILDTEIEPARGAGKMIHQLTIHKTGGMTSTFK